MLIIIVVVIIIFILQFCSKDLSSSAGLAYVFFSFRFFLVLVLSFFPFFDIKPPSPKNGLFLIFCFLT